MPMTSKTLIGSVGQCASDVESAGAAARAAWPAGSGPRPAGRVSASTVTPSLVTERKPPAMSYAISSPPHLDPYPARLLELAQQRRVSRKYGQLTLGGAGDEHLGLARPDLGLDRHELYMELLGHRGSPRGRCDKRAYECRKV